MITIYDDATLAAALAQLTGTPAAKLVSRIASDAQASGLGELTAIAVIEEQDTAEEFEELLGYLPSTGPLGGEGAADLPYWSWLEEHGDLVELLIPAGNEFAWFVLLPRHWFETHIGWGDASRV